jgi:hypothetical protein
VTMLEGIPVGELGASLKGKSVAIKEHQLIQIVKDKQLWEKEKWLLVTRSVDGWQCNFANGTVHFDVTCRVDAWWLDEGHRRKNITYMGATISSARRSAHIHDGIFVDYLQGVHIGSFCMNWLLEWVREGVPGFVVYLPSLLPGQAEDGNKGRRNKFYETFGFEFDWTSVNGVERAAGKARPINACDLRDHRHWKDKDWTTIQTFGLEVGVEKMMKQNAIQAYELSETKARYESAKERLGRKDKFHLKVIARVYGGMLFAAAMCGAALTYGITMFANWIRI